MDSKHSKIRKTGVRALLLPATMLAALCACTAVPTQAAVITFNPLAGGTGAGAISINGFGYATSSALALGLPAPAVGASFNVYYESVINATTGTPSSIGADYSINGSANQFTVIAGFRETITNIAADGTITFNLAAGGSSVFSTSTATPNFFMIFATPKGTVNPNFGTGAGFGSGTEIFRGHLVSDNFGGSFALTQVGGVPTVGPFNTSGLPTAITTSTTLNGGGGTQLTVATDTFSTSYFPTTPGALIFSTTNSLPFAAVAPLSGFYSSPNAGVPNITYPGAPTGGFNPGTSNAVVDGPFAGDNSLMFQTVATSSFTTIVPEPSSIVQVAMASVLIPVFYCFRRRQLRKTSV